ncbi:MAG: TRAP transporter substrate-binding protein DctP [Chloroflexi bacterium]|nr:TRAP transporter substrate-binding protein DctP [Chloroflexota bacterium]
MKRLVFIGLALVLMLSGLLLACSQPAPTTPPPTTGAPPTTAPPTTPPAQVTTLVHSAMDIESTPQSDMDKWYFEEVIKRSGGTIKFQYNFATLTSATETLPAVRGGAVQISNPAPSFFPGDIPLNGLFNGTRVPSTTADAMRSILDVSYGDSEVSKIINSEWTANNVKLLIWHPMDYTFITKKVVTKLADLKGLKLRSVGIFEPKLLDQLGVLAVAVLPAEWYEALSRGTIDGLPAVDSMIVPYKLHEAAKNVSFMGGSILAQPLVINMDTWNKLTPQQKDAFANPDFIKQTTEQFIKMHYEMKERDWKTMKDQGVVFQTVDKTEQEKIYTLWKETTIKEFPKDLAAKGKEADSLKVLDAWLKAVTDKDLVTWKKELNIN